MIPLTRQQKKTYDYICQYNFKNGVAPSYHEVRKGMGLRAVSTVAEHIKWLRAKGLITYDYSRPRMLKPVLTIDMFVEFLKDRLGRDTMDVLYEEFLTKYNGNTIQKRGNSDIKNIE